MTKDVHSRVLALGGMLQSLRIVRQIAETGHADASLERCALDSVFRLDAPNTVGVYGSTANVRAGLLLLREYLSNSMSDPALPKLGMTLLHLERRFADEDEIAEKVRQGILALSDKADRQGSTHPEVIARLGQLYADTISQLKPKVIVQGNPHYLQQADIVAEIRALLLAALRSAVLWRQMGGTLWDFAFGRRAMLQAIEVELA
jgi:high frequency lysogenization protein